MRRTNVKDVGTAVHECDKRTDRFTMTTVLCIASRGKNATVKSNAAASNSHFTIGGSLIPVSLCLGWWRRMDGEQLKVTQGKSSSGQDVFSLTPSAVHSATAIHSNSEVCSDKQMYFLLYTVHWHMTYVKAMLIAILNHKLSLLHSAHCIIIHKETKQH